MKTNNSMQLKAHIKNLAVKKNISAQYILQIYFMERLLERISLSNYKMNFIVKGGFLISAIVGLDTRATMDLDTTIKGFSLTHSAIKEIFDEISSIHLDDNVTFSFNRTTNIREANEYPGIRIHLTANYPPMKVPMTVDVTSGDKITPHEIEYTFPTMFSDRSISIMAYNLETILAEKLETILSRNIANTRPRDFYDIYTLYNFHGAKINIKILKSALIETAKKRNSLSLIEQYENIIINISNSTDQETYWSNYQKEFEYANGISFHDTCDSVMKIMQSAF